MIPTPFMEDNEDEKKQPDSFQTSIVQKKRKVIIDSPDDQPKTNKFNGKQGPTSVH